MLWYCECGFELVRAAAPTRTRSTSRCSAGNHRLPPEERTGRASRCRSLEGGGALARLTLLRRPVRVLLVRFATTAVAAVAMLAIATKVVSGSTSEFRKADLPQLVMTAKDAPAGTRRVFAGPVAKSKQELAALRAFGFEADYKTVFAAPRNRIVAESVASLFRTARGASGSLASLKQRLAQSPAPSRFPAAVSATSRGGVACLRSRTLRSPFSMRGAVTTSASSCP